MAYDDWNICPRHGYACPGSMYCRWADGAEEEHEEAGDDMLALREEFDRHELMEDEPRDRRLAELVHDRIEADPEHATEWFEIARLVSRMP
jgi:hypothetical protein